MQSKSDEITETLFIRALECLRDGIEDTSAIHFEFAVYMRGKGDSDSSLQHFVVAERVAGIFSHIPVNKSIRETSQAMIKLIESGGQMPMGLNCDRERFREGKKNERSQMKLKAAEEVPDAPLPTTDSLDLANETNLGVVSNIGNSKGNRRGRDRGSDRPPSPPSAPRHNP